ncbi:hypothetical protein L249_2064 [Ophiocordyceps polyrhachis-furcata BCC 54312]|uniref:Knr4/Smi1-like domain-containing protein n=1 Tax=Ophiocordyceps polyrhachis-furcata BCC 54312 TaxID=1330021 RepID=A0A367LRE7_9HYPO|nr:hypothetical protein L249_2064 [Ophiocordyceps polyrhachis-furcata BCC 54312]
MESSGFGSALRSFWHTMTSYDRHSSYHSPHRSGRHVPLQNNRSGILTGVATARDSHTDVAYPYSDDGGRSSPPVRNGSYSPGMRSAAAKQTDGFEVQSPGDVPMQSFSDGLPPPPPVSHSWKRIDAWAEDNYPELFDQLCEGATTNDLNDLEHQLDCSLPQDVRQSLAIHDGQERGGNPSGIIFGSMLLDCEEIVQEWETWRKVNQQLLVDAANNAPPMTPSKLSAGSSEASSSRQQRPLSSSSASTADEWRQSLLARQDSVPPKAQRPLSSSSASTADEWRQSLLARQDSVPPKAVERAYAHLGWIPLVRDWGGNNLAVDLAPGPNGRWGQIILFGRDYDTKYVVARSWAAFLALVADDLNSGKWFVDDESGELKLREFKETRVEPAYFSILRWRMDQKHGRRAAKRASMAPPKTTTSPPVGSRSASPYASPTEVNGDARGRPVHRSSPLSSPMHAPPHLKPLPLSRVTEETSIPEMPSAEIEPSQLVEVNVMDDDDDEDDEDDVDTVMARGKNALRISTVVCPDADGMLSPKVNGKQPAMADGMLKTIEI